jgi:hypothetical protein
VDADELTYPTIQMRSMKTASEVAPSETILPEDLLADIRARVNPVVVSVAKFNCLAISSTFGQSRVEDLLKRVPWLFCRGMDTRESERLIAEFPGSSPLFTQANFSGTKQRLLGVDRASFIEHVAVNHSSLSGAEAEALISSIDESLLEFDPEVARGWFDFDLAEQAMVNQMHLKLSAAGSAVIMAIGDSIHLHWWK